ncbi:MAG: hypothetical protein O2819_08580 [Planctomycetota bacterium]|nr:hypothetical protein [Planctomycetota bacterium]MDA1105881.1 hypothetical protein [Planctomycetota bacterium]
MVGVFGIVLSFVLLLPWLPGPAPRLDPSPLPSAREWLSATAVAREELRHRGDGSHATVRDLVGLAFTSEPAPVLPDVESYGWRVTGASVAVEGPQWPGAVLHVALAPASAASFGPESLVILSVGRSSEPLAMFDIFSRPHPIAVGTVSMSDGRGGRAASMFATLVFTQPGLVWALEGEDPTELARLRRAVLSAPRERVDWRDL